MVLRLRKGGSPGVGKITANSQLRNGGTRLRNGTRVSRRAFVVAKIFAAGVRWLRNGFTAEIDFRSGKWDFHSST
uniref:Uncharacterized protein n=1 Tax=Vitis vinifera TaxID=29760 RepID=A5C691_VITVI|nr:hypothetical protein VITISV_026846 [Vitis vinifera]